MHTFLVSWILLVMFTCCFHAYWRSRSVWCQHISNGTDRLTIAFLSVVVPQYLSPSWRGTCGTTIGMPKNHFVSERTYHV